MSKASTKLDTQLDADASERLAAIIDSSFDAIVSKDLDSIIRSWNAAAEKLFGYSQEEAIGQSVLMLIPEHLKGEEAQIIARIRSGERVPSFETVRRRKDGTQIAVSLTISPVRNRHGEIVGASKIARDITAAKENEQRIRMLMREVNHRTKNQFAVILSMIRETSRRSTSPQEFEKRVEERIMALSRSHDLLVAGDWGGTTLFDLVREHLKPFGHESRVKLSGPLLTLNPNCVQHFGMAFHELGTNSAKYGALSNGEGRLSVMWEIIEPPEGPRQLELSWEETSQAAARDEGARDDRNGFGSVVLRRAVPQSVNGTATLETKPDQLRWRLTAPLAGILNPDVTDELARLAALRS